MTVVAIADRCSVVIPDPVVTGDPRWELELPIFDLNILEKAWVPALPPFFDPSRAEREHVLFAGLSGPLTLQDERDKMVGEARIEES